MLDLLMRDEFRRFLSFHETRDSHRLRRIAPLQPDNQSAEYTQRQHAHHDRHFQVGPRGPGIRQDANGAGLCHPRGQKPNRSARNEPARQFMIPTSQIDPNINNRPQQHYEIPEYLRRGEHFWP